MYLRRRESAKKKVASGLYRWTSDFSIEAISGAKRRIQRPFTFGPSANILDWAPRPSANYTVMQLRTRELHTQAAS